MCKLRYRDKLKELFAAKDTRKAWQGLQKASGYHKDKPKINVPNVSEFVDELNTFYCRFDMEDFHLEKQRLQDQLSHCETSFTVKEDEVRDIFKKLKGRKSSGPDGIAPRLLKTCADELSPIFTELFQTSLLQRLIPDIWKLSAIVPVPIVMNDYCPVALTSVVMKCLEKIVLKQLIGHTEESLDGYQFAYRQGRSSEDAVLTLLHCVHSHLDVLNTYTRILYIDFSSAFNTLQSHVMVQRLLDQSIPRDLCSWILDFLSNRKQYVRVGESCSSTITVNTGAPQGCVLSPVLFILYTNNLHSTQPGCHIIKYADDTAVIGNISNGNEDPYRQEVNHVVRWCKDSFLVLNVLKTEEMVVDFRQQALCRYPVFINSEPVKLVEEYIYLGITIDNKLKWDKNIELQCKKGQQRLFFLRKLKYFRLDTELLSLFYSAVVQSVIIYGFLCWWSSLTQKNRLKLDRVRRRAERIISGPLISLEELHHDRTLNKMKSIIN